MQLGRAHREKNRLQLLDDCTFFWLCLSLSRISQKWNLTALTTEQALLGICDIDGRFNYTTGKWSGLVSLSLSLSWPWLSAASHRNGVKNKITSLPSEEKETICLQGSVVVDSIFHSIDDGIFFSLRKPQGLNDNSKRSHFFSLQENDDDMIQSRKTRNHDFYPLFFFSHLHRNSHSRIKPQSSLFDHVSLGVDG